MTNDFVIVGDTISRPRGLERILLDLVCRLTGHLLWRSRNSQYATADGEKFHTSHCRRCWRWGYVADDRWPTTDQKNIGSLIVDVQVNTEMVHDAIAKVNAAIDAAEARLRRLQRRKVARAR